MANSEIGVNPRSVSTGVAGMDDILRGGFPAGQMFLLEGSPGAGKTTFALQFLMAGVQRGEPALYITLSESRAELTASARSHGWSLDGIHIHEMIRADESLSPDSQLTMFHPSELELTETTKGVLAEFAKIKPKLVVFDSLSELRLLAQNALRYRRQILSFKQFFTGRDCTVLLLDDLTNSGEDLHLHSIVHGVIRLDRKLTDYGAERRQLTVCKLRGVQFRGGIHDFAIRKGGLEVFPRLIAAEHHEPFENAQRASGIPEMDRLLDGGLAVGSSTLFIGPAGVGKSTVALQFAMNAANHGQRCALFIFDETTGMLQTRARGLNMPMEKHLKSGLVTVQQIDPSELSPGEFVNVIRQAVDGRDGHPPAKVVMIDSLNGYLHSVSEEKQLSAQLHELFTYLNQRGVNTLVAVTQSGMVGANMHTPIDTTYLADNVVLFRYFEAHGRVRRAISIVKKRSGKHELSIREMRMDSSGIQIGEPLTQFQGVLTGVPTFTGTARDLVEGMSAQNAQDEPHGNAKK